jgi:hypothetical protein
LLLLDLDEHLTWGTHFRPVTLFIFLVPSEKKITHSHSHFRVEDSPPPTHATNRKG